MTGTLALVGGEPFAPDTSFNRVLVAESQATEVLLLPTAAAFSQPDHQIARAVAYFAEFDIAARALAVLDRQAAMDPANAQHVRAARCVYLIGSSAMHARPTLWHTPVWDALEAAWENGATVIGSDAGAQVLGDPMVDDRGGALTIGLGLITRTAVLTRRNEWSSESLHRLHERVNDDVALVAIDDATAAIRSPERSWRAEGRGGVEVRLGGQVIDLGALTH